MTGMVKLRPDWSQSSGRAHGRITHAASGVGFPLSQKSLGLLSSYIAWWVLHNRKKCSQLSELSGSQLLPVSVAFCRCVRLAFVQGAFVANYERAAGLLQR